MIDLRNFTEISTSRGSDKHQSFVTRSYEGETVNCRVSLGDSACSEVLKFIGSSVRLLASDEGEVVIAKGDRRLSIQQSGRGTISASRLLPIFEKLFPDFQRVPVKGCWEQDGDGNKVYLLKASGGYEKRNHIVTGHRLEDKR